MVGPKVDHSFLSSLSLLLQDDSSSSSSLQWDLANINYDKEDEEEEGMNSYPCL
mgnify:CR=1 FL=1